MSLYDIELPHQHIQPVRDMILIRVPYPSKKLGSLIMPDIARELAQHSTQFGKIVRLGPLAFAYQNVNGEYQQHPVHAGDWVLYTWGAGTQFHAIKGPTVSTGGWRYISTHRDAVGWWPAGKFESIVDVDKLQWTDDEADPVPATKKEADYAGPRERITANELHG